MIEGKTGTTEKRLGMARQRSSEGVELNVTAMLDMAFQLLAFFVLTFRQEPTEPAVQLLLPPAESVVVGEGRPPGKTVSPPIQPAGINTLRIGLFSTSGSLDRMTLDGLPVETFEALRDNMHSMLSGPDSPIEQVVVQASESLRYDEVMKVIGICAEQKPVKTGELVKLSLVAMSDSGEK
jgi:biopolymer transport protein ExbD